MNSTTKQKLKKILKHQASLAGFILGKANPLTGPFKVQWEVTYRCNLRCMHCHIWQNPVQEGEELSTEKCIEVIRELAGLDVLNISFSGGEPLLRKDIFDLISHATERGISAGLDTNGVLVSRERAVELARAGIKSIYVSLDSIVPKTHDKIRGVQGTFDKVMEGLENLAGIRKQGKTALFLNTTISRENAFELPSIMKLAKAKGVDGVTFSLLQDVEKYSPESELILKKDNILYLEQQLSILFEEYGDLLPHSKKYFSYFSEFIQNPGIAYNFRCLALFGVIQIAPDGGIFPCPVAFEKIGNLKNHSVREIWKSKQANITRKKIKIGKHPPCWFDCIAPANVLVHDIKKFKFLNLINRKTMKHLFTRMQ